MAKLPYRFIVGTDQEDHDTLNADCDPEAARRVLRSVARYLYLGEHVPTIQAHFVSHAIQTALDAKEGRTGLTLLQQLGLKKKSSRPRKARWHTVGKQVYELTQEGDPAARMSESRAVRAVARETGISESAIRECFRTYRKALKAHML